MVSIKCILITNFMSVAKEEIALDALGLCLVRGKNGSGKSNLFRKALVYCLYGILPEKLKSDEYVSDFYPKDLSVITQLIVDKKKASIERYRNHSEHGNKLRLIIDGNDVSLNDNRETQKRIVRLLDVDFTTFVNSTAFSPDVVLFAESSSTNRGTLLSNILGLHEYEKAHKKVKEKATIASGQIRVGLDRIAFLEDAYKKDIELLSTMKEQQEENEAVIQKEIKDKQIELSTLLDEIGETDELSSTIIDLEQVKAKLIEENYSLLSKQNEAKEERGRVTTHLATANRELKSLALKDGAKCSTCKQIISATVLEEEKKKCEKTVKKYEKAYAKIDLKVDQILHELDSNLLKKQDNFTSIDEANNNLNICKNISLKARELEKEIRQLEIQEPVSDKAMMLLEGNIARNKGENKKLKTDVAIEEDSLKYLRFWEKGFSRNGIPNLLVEQSLGKIQESANKYLAGTGVIVELTGQRQLQSGEYREEVGITIYVAGKTRSYEQLSSGEKKRIDIAFTFSILDLTNNKCNILILDEIFDRSLDAEGCELVMEILNKKGGEVDSLVVISHRDELQEQFNNVINVVRDSHGVSRIEGGPLNGR